MHAAQYLDHEVAGIDVLLDVCHDLLIDNAEQYVQLLPHLLLSVGNRFFHQYV